MILVAIHEWDKHRDELQLRKTDNLPCILCGSPSSVVLYTPEGCTCSPNKIQPRCEHHLMRAHDTGEKYTIIEDFRVYKGADNA